MCVKIKRIEYYHPKTKYSNEYFIEHFLKQGIEISKLLETTGRKNRYVSEDKYENSLTMAVQAAKKLLENTDIDSQKIGLVVFVSSTPEYLSPTNALKIHKALNLSKDTTAYDLNANCCGMLIAVNQIYKIMKYDTEMKYALIIGSDQLFRYSSPTDVPSYSNFAESACAVLLENVENNSNSDFIDSHSYIDNSAADFIMMPHNGFSEFRTENKEIDKDKLTIKYGVTKSNSKSSDSNPPKDVTDSIKVINDIIERNNLTKKDIKLYCLSQFSKKRIDGIRNGLEEPEEKFNFIGDEFGYTGATSPFIALADAIEKNKVKRGDYIIMWTIGAGTIASCTLIRY